MRSAIVAVLFACSAPGRPPDTRTPDIRIADVRLPAGPIPDAPIPDGPIPDGQIPDGPIPDTCDDDVATTQDPYARARLRADVATLAAPALDGRAAGTAGDAAARAWAVARLRCLRLQPAFADGAYTQPFDDTANVVAYLPGDTDEVIVVGAHLDHLGDGHLGANDDASGVAAVLAIARDARARFPDAAHRPRRTLAFALFGAEERGMHGSTYFAAHAPAALALDRVVYDVNLDMVGSYRSRGAVIALGDFPAQPGRAILDALVRRQTPRLDVVAGGRGVGSDHEAFCARGIPYLFFWTPDARCYHERCDTLANLDDVHLAPIAALAGALVFELATTARDLAAARGRLDCGGRPPRPRR